MYKFDGIEFYPIPEEEHYALSRCGKVYSVRYPKILATWTNNRGYECVSLQDINRGGTKRHRLLHRLLVKTFIDPAFCAPLCVDHIDDDPGNNTLDNLRICTYRQNNINKCKGVTYIESSGKWRAQSSAIGTKKSHIGCFDTEREAREAYLAFLRENLSEEDRAFIPQR